MVFRSEPAPPSGPGLVQTILRYRGEGARDEMRAADRALREQVANQYKAYVTRIETAARALADKRALGSIKAVDDFAQTLQLFVDRVRTATYGYSGLWAEMSADNTALDQLRQFDQALVSGDAELVKAVTDLESAVQNNGDVAAAAAAGTAVARSLLARFDLRGQVISTAQPADPSSVLKALGESSPSAPAAWSLNSGDALSVLGDDFIVDARIGVSSGQGNLRLFRLKAEPEEWLLIAESASLPSARVHPVAYPAPSSALVLEGTELKVLASGAGQGEVVGGGGSSGVRPVKFELLSGGANDANVGLLLDWSGDKQAFAGALVHPDDIEIFGPPLGE